MSSLAEVFGAATQAAAPFLQQQTAEMKKRNDLELRNFEARFATDLKDFTRDNPYDGDFNKYLGKLRYFTDERYAKEKLQNTSEYSRNSLSEMRLQSQEFVRNHALEEQDKWNWQQRDVEYINRQNRYRNEDWSAEMKLGAMMDEYDLHKVKQGWTPEKQAAEKTTLYRFFAEGALQLDLADMETVSQAHKKLETNMKDVAAAMDAREGSSGSLDAWVADNKNLLQTAKDAATKAIQKRKFDEMAAMDHHIKGMAQDAAASGDQPGLMETELLRQHWAGIRDAAMHSADYDPADHARMQSMFRATGGGSGSGSGSGNLPQTIEARRAYYIEGINDRSFTYEEGRAMYAQDIGQMAAGYQGGAGAFDMDYAGKIDFAGFWTDAKKELIGKYPEYAAAFKVLDNVVKPWKEKAKNRDERALRELQGTYLGMYLYDKLTDESGDERMTPEQAKDEALRVATHMTEQKIAFVHQKEFTDGGETAVFAKTVKDMNEHGWARFTADGRAYDFGHGTFLDQFKEQAKDNFTAITDIPQEYISASNAPEGTYDESPALTFQVAGLGDDRDGNYRFNADGTTYWVEKYSNEDREWKPDRRFFGTAQEARDRKWREEQEEHTNAQEKSEARRAQERKTEAVQSIKDESDPMRRKALLGAYLAAPMGMQTLLPDDCWQAGINPDSGESINEMPAEVWDRILTGIAPAKRAAQEAEWERAGITRRDK